MPTLDGQPRLTLMLPRGEQFQHGPAAWLRDHHVVLQRQLVSESELGRAVERIVPTPQFFGAIQNVVATELGSIVEGLLLMGRVLKNSAGVPVLVTIMSRSQVRSTCPDKIIAFARQSPILACHRLVRHRRSVRPHASRCRPLFLSTDAGILFRLSNRRPLSSTANVNASVPQSGIPRSQGRPRGDRIDWGSRVPSARRSTIATTLGVAVSITTRPKAPSITTSAARTF